MPSPDPGGRLRARVAVVTVHYRGMDDVLALVDGLPGLPVVVVDNAGEAAELARRLPGAQVLDAGGNVGFARAANLGAAQVTAPLVLFANPDSRPGLEHVRALLEVLDARPEVAAVAPAVVDATGAARGGGGRLPSVRSALAVLAGPLAPAGARVWAVPGDTALEVEVEWLSGACLLVRREAFLAVGGFDEHYPLYNEDMALGARLRRAGHVLVLDGGVRVDHPGGGSSTEDASWLWRARGGALGHFVRREVRTAPRLVQGLLVTAYAVRAAVCALTRRREGAREWATYARGVARAELPVLRP